MLNLKSLKTVTAPSNENPNPRYTLLYGNTGIGKTPIVASHELPPEGGVDTLPMVLEKIGWGKDSLLHIDLEKPSGSSFITSNSMIVQTKEAFLQFIQEYQEMLFERWLIKGVEKGMIFIKKDGKEVPLKFTEGKLTKENINEKLGMKALAGKDDATRIYITNQVERVRTTLTLEEQLEVYPFMVGVVDIYTILLDWCEFFTTDEYKKTTIGKNFKGENLVKESDSLGKWKFWRDTVMYWTFDRLGLLFPHLVLVCHTRDKLINKDGAEVYDSEDAAWSLQDINITGKLASMIASRCDTVGYMYKVKDNPTIQMSFNRVEEHATSKAKPNHMWGLKGGMDFDWNKIFVTPETAQAMIEEVKQAQLSKKQKDKEPVKK